MWCLGKGSRWLMSVNFFITTNLSFFYLKSTVKSQMENNFCWSFWIFFFFDGKLWIRKVFSFLLSTSFLFVSSMNKFHLSAYSNEQFYVKEIFKFRHTRWETIEKKFFFAFSSYPEVVMKLFCYFSFSCTLLIFRNKKKSYLNVA